jgi:hypothetical protein
VYSIEPSWNGPEPCLKILVTGAVPLHTKNESKLIKLVNTFIPENDGYGAFGSTK